MQDVQKVRRDLWNSLEMAFVKMFLFWTAVSAVIMFFVMFFSSMGMDPQERAAILITMMAICILPVLSFCLWRTFRIFQAPESYIFCKTNLSSPMGGRIRDSIKFRVLLEDADGNKFVADTHSIFSTHKGFMGLGFEDYVNQEITVAYNEETGYVVVIG